MDNENNNKVTIDAEWFAELYARWQKKPIFSERMVADGAQAIRDNEELRKERDELKAKLDEVNHTIVVCSNNEVDALKSNNKNLTSFLDDALTKLAAAERCIWEVSKWVGEPNWIIDSRASRAIREIIRAYREQKEAK